MASDGLKGAAEAFLRFSAGDDAFEALDAELRDRMLGNAEVLFDVEFPVFQSYRPPDDALLPFLRAVRR